MASILEKSFLAGIGLLSMTREKAQNIIEELSHEFEGQAVIGKVDVDNCPVITSKYGIRNIPTILFFKNGEVADKHVGAASKQVFTSKLNAIL